MKRTAWALTTLVTVAIALTMVWAAWPQSGIATSTYMGLARTRYPFIVGTYLDSCQLCHFSS